MSRRKGLLSEKVHADLMKRIRKGGYREGDFLEPERVLMADFGVSRTTLRKSLLALKHQGIIESIPCVGYRVKNTRPDTKRKSSLLIGLILESVGSYDDDRLLDTLEREFSRAGYSIVLGVSNLDVSQENGCIERFLNLGVSGIVVVPAIWGKGHAALSDLIDSGFPIVAYGEPRAWCIGEDRSSRVNVVGLDNVAGVNLLMQHLYDLGHRRFGFVRAEDLETMTIRERTFVEFLENRELRSSEKRRVIVDVADANTKESELGRLLRREDRPTALMCKAAGSSAYVLRTLEALGLKVPDDVSVAGFEGRERTQELPVTSVTCSGAEIAREVVNSLMDQIGGRTAIKKALLAPQLTVRSSTAPPGVIAHAV